MLDPDFGPEDFAKATNVSRETLARLKAYLGLLTDWNERHNLVSAASLNTAWRRHFLDSAQLAQFIRKTDRTLFDFGSGAGFPGLVLAILRPELSVTLFESIRKKCDFLRMAADRVGAPIDIRNARIEDSEPQIVDVITARACAPLDRLLGYAQHFAGPNTMCLFLKGQNVEAELTETRNYWRMELTRHPSVSDPTGTILDVRGLAPHDRRNH
jgi:16S rRNA (guanine527-N7)-methyltransferase